MRLSRSSCPRLDPRRASPITQLNPRAARCVSPRRAYALAKSLQVSLECLGRNDAAGRRLIRSRHRVIAPISQVGSIFVRSQPAALSDILIHPRWRKAEKAI